MGKIFEKGHQYKSSLAGLELFDVERRSGDHENFYGRITSLIKRSVAYATTEDTRIHRLVENYDVDDQKIQVKIPYSGEKLEEKYALITLSYSIGKNFGKTLLNNIGNIEVEIHQSIGTENMKRPGDLKDAFPRVELDGTKYSDILAEFKELERLVWDDKVTSIGKMLF